MSQTIKTIGLIFAIIAISLPVRTLANINDCEALDECTLPYPVDTVSVQINFRFDDATVLRDFKDNNAGFSRLESLVTKINNIDSITIIGFTSPDGLSAYNFSLARQRAQAMQSYLYWRYPATRTIPVRLCIEQDLISALLGYITRDNNVPRREKVLEVLSDKSRSTDTRIANLKLITGEPYEYIKREIFPQMRMSVSYIVYYKTSVACQEAVLSSYADTVSPATECTAARQEQVVAGTSGPTTAADTSEQAASPTGTSGSTTAADTSVLSADAANNALPTPINAVDTPISHTCKPLFALKTNLLFDAASLLNVEIEVPIGKRWSVAGEWMFPWWLWEKKQNCLQVMSGTVEGKYWFGNRNVRRDGSSRQQLTGWFAGIYAGGGYYDLEWKRKGYQGEFFIAAGVSGGYAHTINKKGNLRMEYSLGIGYMQTNYRQYEAKIGADNEWHLYRRESGKYTWFGPTRAKISLVWMLDTHLFKKRGGRR